MVTTGRNPRKQKPQTKYDMNLVKLVDQFQSDDDFRTYLESLRWPNGIACLRCGSFGITGMCLISEFCRTTGCT